jgi:hypothetical protein
MTGKLKYLKQKVLLNYILKMYIKLINSVPLKYEDWISENRLEKFVEKI